MIGQPLICLGLAAAAVGIARRLQAQDAPHGAPVDTSRAHGQHCVWPLPTSDSTLVTMGALLEPVRWSGTPDAAVPRPLPAEDRMPLLLVLEELRAHFHVPHPLSLEIGIRTPFAPASVSEHTATGPVIPSPGSRVALTLHADGRITGLAVEERSPAVELDSALLHGLQQLSATGTLSGVLAGYRTGEGSSPPDSLRLRLSAGLFPEKVYQDSLVASRPLFRMQLPAYHRATPVFPDPRNDSPPYPALARRAGATGEVLVAFVVDTSGQADMGTVRVLKASYREFIEAVLGHLPTLRFQPATIDGCPVRQLVQQTFRFNLR